MIMFGIILLWLYVGILIDKSEKRKKRQRAIRAKKSQRSAYNYCVCDRECYSQKSA